MKFTEKLSVLLSKEQREELDEVLKKYRHLGMTYSDFIRAAILEKLDKEKSRN